MSEPESLPPDEEAPPADPALEAFVEMVDRIGAFDDAILPEWVDGFFTALIAGPRVVMPSEWIPAIFGDTFERVFADPPDAERGLKVLYERWNAIASQLHPEGLAAQPDQLRLHPLMMTFSEEERATIAERDGLTSEQADLLLTGRLWASGFLDAVEAFEADWQPPRKDRDAADWLEGALEAIEAIACPPADTQAYVARAFKGEPPPTRDELIDEALFAVQDLRMFWLEHGHKPEPIRAEPKQGRNDPCACGSGRKYKHCHGAPN